VSGQEISSNISGVSQAAGTTGGAAGQVHAAASELSKLADELAGQVSRFLTNMRAA
jgi:methyl-accepting chemotaxis protein